jgi:PAS domain S-box-containing protein
VLELTESMLASGDDLLERLEQLHRLGVRLAVDDFGTGYSSLAYLRRFPIDVLKIDRSFVAGIAARHTDATLASTIIELGRLLDLTTVAEGIEQQDQLDLLRSLGCRIGQGFLFAKPLPPEELEALISDAPVFEMPSAREAEKAATAARRPMFDAQPEMLSKLVDNAADALALIDKDATLLYASEAVHRLLGYPLDERIGRDTLELVHPDDLPGVLEALVTTIATPGVKSPLSLRMRCADGSYKPIEIISNNMLDEPSIGGVVVMMRDRSEPTIAAVDNVTTVITPVGD